MSSKRQKSNEGGALNSSSRTVFLVSKHLEISVDDFGDLSAAFPDCDYQEQSEDEVKGQIEEDVRENYKTIFTTYEKAFSVAQAIFLDTKKYVNSLAKREDEDEITVGVSEIDISGFVVDPMLIEDVVEFEFPMNRIETAQETDEVNQVSATIKVTITAMTLDEE